METIWLQRPSGDIPWGFRLQGGREFAQPLTVQRVTPGSVASNGLGPGDLILKIGSVNATNLTLSDAQEVIKGATNLLQFTIKKGAVPPSPMSPTQIQSPYTSSPQQQGYNSSPYDQEPDQKYNFPDYRIGSGYEGQSNTSSPGGYNSPYASQPNEYAPSGYTTLPARSGQSNESFRPTADPQAKYPYKSSAGIKLQMNPQTQRAQDDSDIYNQQRSSPVQYQNNAQDPQYQRQSSSGSNPPSYHKPPTPFSPTYNGNPNTMPSLQRQTSSGSQGNTAHLATVSSTSSTAPSNFSPGSDEGPPHPPPPVNYRQPEPYQRQGSQPGQYNSSPYGQRQNSYDPYQQQQPGMYVDTGDNSAPQYQRQGSRPQEYGAPQYQPPQSQPNFYNPRPVEPPQPPPQPYQRQPSYGSQPTTPSSYSSPYTPTQPPQPYSRQGSRDQNPPSLPMSPPGQSGINSFEDILQPFENFKNSNYCDKLFSRDNRGEDSGVISDYSHSMSDTPRSTQSSYSGYSPPQPGYPSYGGQPPHPVYPGFGGQQPQNLLQPATAGPPPPATTPPPPPPPPPPSDWQSTPRRAPPTSNKPSNGPGGDMPDKVLNTMMKNTGSQKPFAYIPTGMDLKKFKERARARQQKRPVMPRGYDGPALDEDDDKVPSGPPNPDTGVYKHAQYNSPLKMYSSDNAREQFDIQSGGQHDVTPGANGPYYSPPRHPQQFITVPQKTYRTPDRRTSDIKDSEVYKMIKEADAKGKIDYVTSDLENEAEQSCDQEGMMSPRPAARGKGLSFRVLQWLTDTADDDQENETESYKPKKPRDPLLRHNSEDDEMTFSGLHTKADIPSKTFSRLNKMVISDASPAVGGQQSNQQDEDEEPSRIGNYDEASIRYRGNYIPSPSFRLLQSMARNDERSSKTASPATRSVADDDEDDGLPDKLSEEDMVDKRYTGANIPSKSFKALQLFTDEGIKGGPVGQGSPKIKVVSRAGMSPQTTQESGTATPPITVAQPVDNPCSDF